MAISPSPRKFGDTHQEQDVHHTPQVSRPFGRPNFIAMAICLIMIIAGFALMSGPGSTPQTGFNPDIFSTRRIVVGPTIAFLGFLLMAFAIVMKPETLTRIFTRKTGKGDKG